MTHSDSSHPFSSKKSLIQSWILSCLLAAATMICISISIGWQLRASDLEGSSPRPSAARSVLLTLAFVAFDPLTNIVTLDWWIIGDDCVIGAASNPEPTPQCPVVNIFVNPCVFLTYFSGISSMARAYSTQSLNSGGATRQLASD